MTVAAVAIASTSSANGTSKKPCRAAGSRVLVENAVAQVYQRGNTVRGCVRGRGRRGRTTLAEGSTPAYPVPAITLRGTLVAYGRDDYREAQTRTEVIVRDLRRPRAAPTIRAETAAFIANVELLDARTVAG